MVERTSKLKLVVDATKAVASTERLSSALLKLGQIAKGTNAILKTLIPGQAIASAAGKAASAVSSLAVAIGSKLYGAIKKTVSVLGQFASAVGGRVMGGLKAMANFIKNTVVEAFRTLARNAVRSLGLFAGSLVKVQVEIDKFHSIMTLSVGSAKEGVAVFDELAGVANTFGLTLEGNLMKEFTKFRTVMVQAGISGKEFMKIFGNFSQVANVFHLGTQDMQFAILALTQMVSKGKVSMEEMRRQLAERLPGTMQVAAKAFNTTTRELELAITQGFVNPVILIQGMMEEFAKMTAGASLKAVNSMEARLGRLSNGFFEIKRALLDGGLTKAFVNFFERIQALINYLIDTGAVDKFGESIGKLGNTLIAFFSNTQGIKAWWSDMTQNWGAILGGSLVAAFEWAFTKAKEIWLDFMNSFNIVTTKRLVPSLTPMGGLEATQALFLGLGNGEEKLMGSMRKIAVGFDVIMTESGKSAGESWSGGWEEAVARSSSLFAAIAAKGVDPLVELHSKIRNSSQVVAGHAPSVIASQIAQMEQIQGTTRTMLKQLAAAMPGGEGVTNENLSAFAIGAQPVLDVQGAADAEINRLKELVVEVKKSERQLADALMTGGEGTLFFELDEELMGLSDTLSGQFVDGLMDGKLAFKDMADTIIKAMMNVVVEILIVIPLMNALKAAMSAGAAYFSGTGYAGSIPNEAAFGNTAGGPIVSQFPSAGNLQVGAKGMVLSKSSVTAFAKGGLVNSPTVFPMKNGAGLMGEAGPEAVMPLTRDSQGRLGVRNSGGGGGGGTVQNIININTPKGYEAETTEEENDTGGFNTEVIFRQMESRLADRVSKRQGPMFQTLQRGGHSGVLG